MDTENIIGYVVNSCGYCLRQTFFDFMDAHNHSLTPEEALILHKLWMRDKQTQSELLQVIYKGPSTLSRQLDALEKKQLIIRKPCVEDKRKTRVHLTHKGKEMEKELMIYGEKLLANLGEGISQEDLDKTINILNRLRDNAIKYSQELKS